MPKTHFLFVFEVWAGHCGWKFDAELLKFLVQVNPTHNEHGNVICAKK